MVKSASYEIMDSQFRNKCQDFYKNITEIDRTKNTRNLLKHFLEIFPLVWGEVLLCLWGRGILLWHFFEIFYCTWWAGQYFAFFERDAIKTNLPLGVLGKANSGLPCLRLLIKRGFWYSSKFSVL